MNLITESKDYLYVSNLSLCASHEKKKGKRLSLVNNSHSVPEIRRNKARERERERERLPKVCVCVCLYVI